MRKSLSRYHALSFVHVMQVYAKMNGNQRKRYVVNQNQILKKLNLNLVWNIMILKNQSILIFSFYFKIV